MSRCSGSPLKSCGNASLPREAVLNCQKLHFYHCSLNFEVQHDMCDNRQQACPFPAGVVSLVSGEVKHIVHNSLELESRLCQLGQELTTCLEWLNARLLGLGAESCCLTNCFGFLVCHQLVPHLVPNFPRVPLRNVSWGLGVCAVLVRSVSPCRLVPEVRLFPSPPALFLAVCPSCVRFFLPLAFQG